MMRKMVLAAVMALALAGCNMGADLSATDAAVQDFHAKLNAEQYAVIESAAGSEVKTGGPNSFAGILEQVHTKLGTVKSSSRTGFNDKVNNGVHTVELNYTTVFDAGQGSEDFVYRLNGGQAQLIGYYVKSDALK